MVNNLSSNYKLHSLNEKINKFAQQCGAIMAQQQQQTMKLQKLSKAIEQQGNGQSIS